MKNKKNSCDLIGLKTSPHVSMHHVRNIKTTQVPKRGYCLCNPSHKYNDRKIPNHNPNEKRHHQR